ncbi:MAG: sigma-54-dependent Fis family transcriptional regulator [Pirellulales bacterium]|nr:sigma-54-dependent Fis family transcriptional regulator [Pirellulales bacterium]
MDSLDEFDLSQPSYELRSATRSLVTYTPAMFDMLAELEVAATHDVTVLLIGETGSGKTYLARLIHELSSRVEERFCTVACGALPPDLIESELFGHVKGAFTGAERDKAGKFAAAGRGSLLLDEIDVLPLDHQAKLLRVLETGEYEPVGSNDTAHNESRLIVASNYDLEQLVAANRFRMDLYYRLNVLKFHLLPLRERPRDVEFLARQFVARHAVEHGIVLHEITSDFLDALANYDWPGNIRELENVTRRAVLYCRDAVLTSEQLPSNLRPARELVAVGADDRRRSSRLELSVETHERRIIEESLARHQQHRGATARSLGISRVTLYNKMKKFGLLG